MNLSKGAQLNIIATVLFCWTFIPSYAQADKPFEISLMALGNISTAHTGTGTSGHTPLWMGYQELTADWSPWLNRSMLHKFAARVIATQGAQPSANTVGDIQVFSNIEAGDYVGLFELYYLHRFNKEHSLLIGQSDLCTNFLSMDAALWFSNSSFGALPTASVNNPVPVFPTASPSLIYTCQKTNWRFSFGLFDGDPGDAVTNRHNLQPRFSSDEGALLISEFQYSYGSVDCDNLIVGLHHHTVNDTSIDGQLLGTNKLSGIYLMGQKGFGSVVDDLPTYQVFMQYGHSPETGAVISDYVGLGVVRHNLFEKLTSDCAGLAMAQARTGTGYYRSGLATTRAETAVELFFETQIAKRFFLHPSVSYIVNPGFRDSKSPVLVSNVYVRFEL